jgi:Bacterial extracellular solute-binding proteins, family 3
LFNALRLLPAAFLFWHLCASGVQVVRYPAPEMETDRRHDYPRELVSLALSKTKTDYRVEFAPGAMNQEREVLELEAGRTIDVSSIPSSPDREARLLPIRIPVNKGLLGWRIGLVRRGDLSLLANVKNLGDLAKVRIAQGHEWPDTRILQDNGINVIRGSTYEGLFKMLGTRRFDYFPRSVMEIWDERDANGGLFEIEPHIALHYFYDAYLFVNKRNTKLAEDIRQGLEAAIADGSFDRLFQKHWGERVRQARLCQRIVIELRNPLLTPQTPKDRPELWFDPKRDC